MGKLLPIILAMAGLAAGAGAGLALKPETSGDAATPPATDPHAKAPAHDTNDAHGTKGSHDGHGAENTGSGHDYVKLNNQFVVPVVQGGRMSALVVMSLSLEVDANGKEPVYALEPKLRDAFLRVMFDHANAGGFDGAFTESGRMRLLRKALVEVAQGILGQMAHDVLITDLVRQDS